LQVVATPLPLILVTVTPIIRATVASPAPPAQTSTSVAPATVVARKTALTTSGAHPLVHVTQATQRLVVIVSRLTSAHRTHACTALATI
jgi:hypothetical protein